MNEIRFIIRTMEPDELRGYLIREYQNWFYAQRQLHLPHARELSDLERARFGEYFDKKIFNLTRIAKVDRVSNPEFYGDLVRSGMPIPMNFTQAIGFTLIDCVLIRETLFDNSSAFISTLFHEMVHVVQFDILGPERMIELYTDFLIEGEYQYHSVPFERQAYALTDRFVMEESSFPVRKIVERELKDMV